MVIQKEYMIPSMLYDIHYWDKNSSASVFRSWAGCLSLFGSCILPSIICTDLIFVTDITDYIRGEKSVKWRNFRFL